MKSLTRVGSNIAIAFALTLNTLHGHATALFSDGFESGNLSTKQGAALWGAAESVSVSTSTAKSGSNSAKFHFTGNTDPTADAWSELRFDLGQLSTEVWIQFDLYIPTNFKHRTPSGPANDKFLRLWGVTYDDAEKVGFSTFPYSGYSSIAAEWDDNVLGLTNGGGMNPYGVNYPYAITSADLGKWVTYKIYVKAATSSTNGTIKLWKNGTLIVDDTGKVNNYRSSGVHAFRYGYLLGWSNSGYDSNTDFYVDNVTFATSESDLPGAASPPAAPTLQVSANNRSQRNQLNFKKPAAYPIAAIT